MGKVDGSRCEKASRLLLEITCSLARLTFHILNLAVELLESTRDV